MPPTKRKADDELNPLVAEYHYTGMYQPCSVWIDDEEENSYVPTAAFHLHLTLVWDDQHNKTGNVRGDLYWKVTPTTPLTTPQIVC